MKNEVLIQTIQGFIDCREKNLTGMKETAKLLNGAIPIMEQGIGQCPFGVSKRRKDES